MKIINSTLKSKWIIIIILFMTFAATAVLIKTGPKPQKRKFKENVHQVQSITVKSMTIVPKATGYGQARPAREWDAVAQVSGKIVWKNQKLKSGEFFKTGDLLLKIDSSRYKLGIRRSEADVKKYEAKIQELKSNRQNLEKQLKLHQQTLAVNEKNLKRQKKLFKSKIVALATVEEEEISVLQQQNSLENIQSTLNLIPAQIAYQEAELAAALSTLEQSKLDLSYTQIRAPFNCLIDTVSVEEQQFVTEGQTMFEIDSTDKAEVTAHFSIDQLAILAGEPPAKVSEHLRKSESRPSPKGFKAVVKSCNSTIPFSWPASFERFASGLDQITRMVSMVVGVNKPYELNLKKFHPPLAKGLFCAVEITGHTQPDKLVIPRDAIHGDTVYLVDKNSRLQIRKINIKYYYDKYAIIANGLTDGEMLVTSDLLPAINGMKLKTDPDKNFSARVKKDLNPSAGELVK